MTLGGDPDTLDEWDNWEYAKMERDQEMPSIVQMIHSIHLKVKSAKLVQN